MSDQWNWEEEQSESSGFPRYTHYQVQTDMENDAEESSGEAFLLQEQDRPEEKLPRRRPERREKKEGILFFRKYTGAVVALAVVFGLVAGLVFQGVNFLSGYFFEEDEPDVGTLMSTERIAAGGFQSSGDFQAENMSVSSESSQPGNVAAVAQAAMSAVVAITSVSIQEIPTFFGYRREYPSTGSGSGIIVGENDEELLIATNNHVVEGADTLSVCFIGNDAVNAEEETLSMISGDGDINVEDAVTAKIKGTDSENDLAVIAVRKNDIPESTMSQIHIIQLGSSQTLAVGEQVVAIGNALGYGQSVTSGWISALDRTVYTEDGISTDLIQTDAAINPGNSGGALLNMQGELIGINSVKYASNAVEGMGYAIPISKAQPILEELMSRQTREKVSASQASYLGIQVADITVEVTKMYNLPSGVFVIETTQDGPAEQAGIRRGDIIIRMDAQRVTSRSDFAEKLTYYAAGETIEFIIARLSDGEYVEQPLQVTLGSRMD